MIRPGHIAALIEGLRGRRHVRFRFVAAFEAFEIEFGHIEDGRTRAGQRRHGVEVGIGQPFVVQREGTLAPGLAVLLVGEPWFVGNALAIGAALAFACHRGGAGKPAGKPRADKSTQRRHQQRQQDARGHAERRREHGKQRIDSGREDDLFDQARPDRHAAQPEQRAEPQRDGRREQRMLRQRLRLCGVFSRDFGQLVGPLIQTAVRLFCPSGSGAKSAMRGTS